MSNTSMAGSWMEYDVVVRKNVPVPMRDGVPLAADIYLPARDGAVADGLATALLVLGPDAAVVESLDAWALVVDPAGVVHELGERGSQVSAVEILTVKEGPPTAAP